MSASGPGAGHHIRAHRRYRDSIKYKSRVYVGRRAGTAEEIKLGPLVTHINKSLAASDTGNPYQAPELTDNGATFLPVGASVYEVVGRSPDTHLAAYFAGRLHIYVVRDG